MSARGLLAGLTLVVFVAGGVASSAEVKARGKKGKQRTEAPKFVVTTYPVADLVIPIDMEPGDAKRKETKWMDDTLIHTIITTVAPQSWKDNGGRGTIQFFPLGMALVVNQTAEVQEQVFALLNALRRLQDQEVSVQVMIAHVSDATLERFQAEHDIDLAGSAEKKTVALLDEVKTRKLLETAQGDRRTQVMQLPKITMFNAQHARIFVGDHHSFATDFDVVPECGRAVIRPKTEVVKLGVDCPLCALILPDRDQLHVNFKLTMTSLQAPPKTVPVVLATGNDGEHTPTPLQFCVQKPKVNTIAVEKLFKAPSGHTAAMLAGKVLSEVRTEFGPPVVSRIPYVNRMFRTVGYSREAMNIVVLVTPRIVVNEAEELRPPQFRSGLTPAGTFTPDLAPIPRF